jgi:hypothetical protein
VIVDVDKPVEIVRNHVRCGNRESCYTPNLHELRDLIFAIDQKIASYGSSYVQHINWGYACFSTDRHKVKRLINYKKILRRYYLNLKDGLQQCLCPDEIQSIKGKVVALVDMVCCTASDRSDITIDYSAYDQWVISNPDCVVYNEWERVLKCITPEFLIVIEKLEDECKVLFDMLVERDTTASENACKVLAVVEKMNCDIDFKIEIVPEECAIEYKILVEKFKCDFTLKAYVELKKCNLSFKVVTELLDCGYKLRYNVKKQCAEMVVNSKVVKVNDLARLAGGVLPEAMGDIDLINDLYD